MDLLNLVAKLTMDTSSYDKSLIQSKKKMSDYKSDVMKLAQKYKKQGASMADAMKKAYSEIDKSQYETEATSEKTSKGFFKNWDSSKIKSVASKLGSGVKKIASTVTKVTAVAVTAASTAVVGFGKSAVTAGSQFDTSMSQVAATMGKSTDEIKDLREFAKKMGRETAFSASQAADALNYMALAGYDSKTSMSMLPNVLNLAAAGSIDLADASDMVTNAQTALGLSLDDTSKLVDKMAKASSKTNTSVAQLGEAILTVGGTAKNLKGGTTELSTALGLLADNGVQGAEGGTALRNIILSLSAPTDSAAKAIKALGVEVFDEQGNMRDLESIFTDLNASLSTMSQGEQTQALNKIFNKVDLKSVNALLGTSVGRWDEVTKEIDNATGSAQKMADTQLDNLAGDITKFKSALEGAQIETSEKLTPSLREFVQLGTTGISEMTTAFKEDGLEGLMAAFGETLNKGIELIISKMPEIISAGVTLLETLIEGIESNLDQVIEASSTIISTLSEAAIENLPKIVDMALQIMISLAESLLDNLPKIIKAALKIIVSLANGITKALPKLIPAIVDCIREIVDTLTNPKQLAQIINAALDLVITLVEGIIDNLDELMDAAIQIILNIVEYLLTPKNLAKLVSAALRIQIALAGGLIKAIPQVIKGIAQLIMKIGETITHHDWSSLGKNIVDGVFNGLKNAWNSISSWWSDSWNGLVNSVEKWLEIKSPSRVFKRIGKYTAEGFGIGWKDEFADVSDDVGDDLDFSDIAQIPNDYSTGIETTSYISKVDDESSKNDQPIQVSLNIENFSNNTDDDLESIVDKLMEMMSEKTNRRGFVYA